MSYFQTPLSVFAWGIIYLTSVLCFHVNNPRWEMSRIRSDEANGFSHRTSTRSKAPSA